MIFDGSFHTEPCIYLTFDDGPIPETTEFVLDLLKKAQGKATFFMVGENVLKYPNIYKRIIEEGHSIGNHTHHHLNGYKISTIEYLEDIEEANKFLSTNLFRPPYGRLKTRQAAHLKAKGYQVVLWSLLTGDFDENLSPQLCWEKIKNKIRVNDVIVLHDSKKAWERMSYILPRIIDLAKNNRWKLKEIPFKTNSKTNNLL